MSRFNTVQHGSSWISKKVHVAVTVITRFITVYLGSSIRDSENGALSKPEGPYDSLAISYVSHHFCAHLSAVLINFDCNDKNRI